MNAALRTTTEEVAARLADHGRPDIAGDQRARLSAAVRVATHGLIGNALAASPKSGDDEESARS